MPKRMDAGLPLSNHPSQIHPCPPPPGYPALSESGGFFLFLFLIHGRIYILLVQLVGGHAAGPNESGGGNIHEPWRAVAGMLRVAVAVAYDGLKRNGKKTRVRFRHHHRHRTDQVAIYNLEFRMHVGLRKLALNLTGTWFLHRLFGDAAGGLGLWIALVASGFWDPELIPTLTSCRNCCRSGGGRLLLVSGPEQ